MVAALDIVVEVRRQGARRRHRFESTRLFQPVAAHFSKEHARDADALRRGILDRLSLCDRSSAAVDGFIGVLITRGAAPPFEEAYQVAPDLQVPAGRRFTIGAERL